MDRSQKSFEAKKAQLNTLSDVDDMVIEVHKPGQKLTRNQGKDVLTTPIQRKNKKMSSSIVSSQSVYK